MVYNEVPCFNGGMFTTSPSTAAVFQIASPSSKHSTNTRKHAAKSCDMADTEECPSRSLGPTFVESSTAQVSYLVRVPIFLLPMVKWCLESTRNSGGIYLKYQVSHDG